MNRVRLTTKQIFTLSDMCPVDAVLIDIEEVEFDIPEEEGNIRVIIDGALPSKQIVINTDGHIE